MSDKATGGKSSRSGSPKAETPPARTARSGVQLKKKELVDSVATASGLKKADVRATLDAALALFAERLQAGDELVLPPLGRLRLLKEKQTSKARIATLRLQHTAETDPATDPLAEADD